MEKEIRKKVVEIDDESLGQVVGGVELGTTQEEVVVVCSTCRSRAVVNLVLLTNAYKIWSDTPTKVHLTSRIKFMSR